MKKHLLIVIGLGGIATLLFMLVTVLLRDWGGLERMTRKARELPVVNGETLYDFETGGRFALEGTWRMTNSLQGPRALVFTTAGFGLLDADLAVLEAGADTPRRAMSLLQQVDSSRFETPRMLGWVENGDALVGWFDESRQLCRADVATGEVSSLASFPGGWTRDDSEKKWRMERPVVRRQAGMVEDRERGRLSFLVESPEPNGSYELVSVSLAGGDIERPFVEQPLAGDVLAWELSLKRGELFVLVEAPGGQELRVHDLEGRTLRNLDLPDGGASGIHLSSGQGTLLVERTWKPSSGGFVLLDLDTDATRAGPTAGRNAAWSPDGSVVAYLERSELRMWNVATGESRMLARSESDPPADTRSRCDHVPEWSPDGLALLTCCHVGHWWERVALELDGRSFVMLYPHDSDHMWAPPGTPLDG